MGFTKGTVTGVGPSTRTRISTITCIRIGTRTRRATSSTRARAYVKSSSLAKQTLRGDRDSVNRHCARNALKTDRMGQARAGIVHLGQAVLRNILPKLCLYVTAASAPNRAGHLDSLAHLVGLCCVFFCALLCLSPTQRGEAETST